MNKKILALLGMTVFAYELFSQTTTFDDSHSIISSNGKYMASLYSVTLEEDYTLATIKLVPLEDMEVLPIYTGSHGTHVKLGDFMLPLLGLYDGEDFRPCDFDSHIVIKDAKQGNSYYYTLGFEGHIPAGYTDFTLEDVEDTEYHGFSFKGYVLNNPSNNATSFTNAIARSNILDNNDGICGIYEFAESDNILNVACIKKNSTYQVIYLDSTWPFPWWHEGDIIGDLRATATNRLYKAEWYDPFKKVSNEPIVAFDGISMIVEQGDDASMIFVKMFPSSNNISLNPPLNQSYHKLGLHNGDVYTIDAGSGIPLYVEASSFAKVLHTLRGTVQIRVVKVGQAYTIVKSDSYEGYISNEFLY